MFDYRFQIIMGTKSSTIKLKQESKSFRGSKVTLIEILPSKSECNAFVHEIARKLPSFIEDFAF